jgi:hypothetical protein
MQCHDVHKDLTALCPAVDWFVVYLLENPPWYLCDRLAAFAVARPSRFTGSRTVAGTWVLEDYREVVGIVPIDDEGFHVAGEDTNFYCYVHKDDIERLAAGWIETAQERARKREVRTVS